VYVSGTRLATAGSIPAKLEYVVCQGYISSHFFHFRDFTYFKRDMRHLKKWLISAQRHQMLSSCPFLRSPSSKMKKSPQALVQILSPGGARGDFTFYPLIPTVKKNAR
jgi:hypothetical protein